jgi:hypothetical protein
VFDVPLDQQPNVAAFDRRERERHEFLTESARALAIPAPLAAPERTPRSGIRARPGEFLLALFRAGQSIALLVDHGQLTHPDGRHAAVAAWRLEGGGSQLARVRCAD